MPSGDGELVDVAHRRIAVVVAVVHGGVRRQHEVSIRSDRHRVDVRRVGFSRRDQGAQLVRADNVTTESYDDNACVKRNSCDQALTVDA
jgi:D-alanine-D-alanine ligase-like ATP-grasp enzyme